MNTAVTIPLAPLYPFFTTNQGCSLYLHLIDIPLCFDTRAQPFPYAWCTADTLTGS
jgi:hypothetical protein